MLKIVKLLILILFFVNSCFSQKSIVLDKKFSAIDIVLLGEQTHGDGAVFDEKVQMIKYLHENHNFNIIVFESGLYDNFKASQLYRTNKEKINIYNQSVFSIWSDTKTFQELLTYIEENPEMKILGFDSQEFLLFENFYLDDLKKMMTNHSITITDKIYAQIEKVLIFRDFEQYLDNSSGFEKVLLSFNEHLKSIPNKNLEEKIITQTFKSALSDLKYSYNYEIGKEIILQNPRDKQMAENFTFLKNQFPNEKFIAWGASYHFANKLADFSYTSITEDYIKKTYEQQENKVTSDKESELQELIDEIKKLKYAIPMGKILKDHYKDKLYSIAFTSYEGEYNDFSEKKIKIMNPPQNSIEYKLHTLKKGNILIDLKQYTDKKFYASVLGYLPLYTNWETVFDGIYYIPVMYPPNQIEYLPQTFNNKKLSKAQQIIKGQIFDIETKKPLDYTDVYYRSSNKSVVTNANGKYVIDKSKNRNDFIFFSSIGYDTDSIKISSMNSFHKLYLKPTQNINTLDEVVIIGKTKKLSAKDIVKKARKKIKENYIQKPYNQLLMYKVQSYDKNDTLNFNEQALINTYNKRGINGNSVYSNFYGEINHLINTTNNFSNKKWDKWSGTGNLWGTLSKGILMSKTNVLYRTASYDLTKEGIVKYNGKDVYKISFVNNSPGPYSVGYAITEKSNGFIYIDRETFAVLRYEHCIIRKRYSPKKSNNSYKNTYKIVETYKELNGLYFINLLEVKTKTDKYSKKDTLLNTYYDLFSITSQDIETENVIAIERPIKNLTKGYKYIKKDDYWIGKDANSITVLSRAFDCQ